MICCFPFTRHCVQSLHITAWFAQFLRPLFSALFLFPGSQGGTPLTKHRLVSKFRRLLATAGVTGHARAHRDYSHIETSTSIRLLFIICHFVLDVCSHVTGVAFPSTQPGLFRMRVAEKLLFSSFSLPVFLYSKLLSVPKHKLRVLFFLWGTCWGIWLLGNPLSLLG